MGPKKAFTLVELMTVIAIIGILVAVAVPNFVSLQYRTKRAEAPVNVDAIVVAQRGYDAAHDGFRVCAEHPAGGPNGKQAVPWSGGNTDFQLIGWAPDGDVRGAYSVTTLSASSGKRGADFTVSGRINVDGDGQIAVYTATRSTATTFLSASDTY